MTQAQQPRTGWQVYRRLLGYSARHWKLFLVAIVGMLIFALSQLLFAKFIEPMLDDTFIDKDAKAIFWVPIVLVLIYGIRVVGTFLSTYFMAVIARSVVRSLRRKVFDHYLRLPTRYFDTNSSGALISRMVYDVEQLADAASGVVTVLIRGSITIIFLLIFMFHQSAQLTGLLMISLPFLFVIVAWVSKRFRRLSHRIQNSMGDVSSITEEALEANREIKIFGGRQYENKRFEEINQHNWRQFLKYHATNALSSPITEFIVALAFAGVLYFVTQPGMIETMSPGKFMSFLTAMLLLLQQARPLASMNAQLQRGIAAAQGIFFILDQETERDTGRQVVERVKGNIVFDKVTFRYNMNSSAVLDELSLEIKAGESVAFVGRSGAGKTSLVSLLPRFYDFESGRITIDGYDIRELSLDSLRSQIALVSQHVTLFNDTIAHNIAYGALETAKQSDIERAASAAHAIEFISKLENGFETLTGENGVMLSGGQRQRLAIARAILKDAPILILDEATSALDTESERLIQSALDEVMRDRTTLVIAHRLSTIERVDKIVVMDHGRVVETGRHQELLDRKGAYYSLYNMQFAGQQE